MINKRQKTDREYWYTLKPLGFNEVSISRIPRIFSVGFFISSLLFISLCVFFPMAQADFDKVSSKPMISSEAASQPFGERKNLRGTVGAVNHEGMAFVTKTDLVKKTETEMWFPFASNPRLSGYSTTADIQVGDEAVVTYEEDKEGTRRVLREVNFVQHQEPPAPAADEEENEKSEN